ncbi:hypothetical protein ACJBUE_23130 (plasmid) [Ralstonia syzygii subsp. celebesensis]|nr:hypothetical protein [Ralstonia syzygii]
MNPKPGLRWCAAITSLWLTTSFVPSSYAASVAPVAAENGMVVAA